MCITRWSVCRRKKDCMSKKNQTHHTAKSESDAGNNDNNDDAPGFTQTSDF